MQAIFVELPPFERLRSAYLSDQQYADLQQLLMIKPEAGDIIPGTGGLRKMRFSDPRRHKGRRGGLRVIYYWWDRQDQFWLFTLYDKDQADDLTADQRALLKRLLLRELEARGEQHDA